MDKYEENCLMVMQSDPFETILNFMDSVSIYQISQTCKHYNKNIKRFREKIIDDTIDNINNKLMSIFGSKYEDFMKIMSETFSVITGSFIIQSILNEYWEDTDIDIYVPNIGSDQIEDFIINNFRFDREAISRSYSDNLGPEIYSVVNYSTPNLSHKIQIIIVDVGSSFECVGDFIDSNFDFDICKNKYYNDGKLNLHVRKLRDIMSKEAEFGIGCDAKKSILRAYKYIKRGFTFSGKLIDYKLLIGKIKIGQIIYCTSHIFEVKKLCHDEKFFKIMESDHDILKSWCTCEDNTHGVSDKISLGGISHFALDEIPFGCNSNKLMDCRPDCIVKFASPSLKHYHYDNISIKGCYHSDFIFVVTE